MRLKDKIAIITGAGAGLGRAMAMAFTKEGAKVAVADWYEKGGIQTVNLIKKQNGEAFFIQADVSNPKDVDKLVGATIKKYGHLDIMVNNAGIAPEKRKPFHQIAEDEWNEIIKVNLGGVFNGCKRAIPELLKTGRGKIINIASIAGMVGYPGISQYSASKGGIIALSKSLAAEYGPKINVNCIAPGIIKTQMTEKELKNPIFKAFLKKLTPMNRFGEPEEIANAALYLASPESDFVTGHVLVVDGGWIAK